MRLVLTFLRNWWISLIEFALTGTVAATALGVLLGHVRTFGTLPVWGAWGVLFGVLIGAGIALLAERPTHRACNKAREVIGLSATDADCTAALRASVRGPVPDDPKIRRAAARLAAGRLEHVPPRNGMILLITGGVLFTLAVLLTAENLSDWPFSCVGWGMLTQQVRTWRVHRRVSRLTEIPTPDIGHRLSNGRDGSAFGTR
jgi:hypothetical protein